MRTEVPVNTSRWLLLAAGALRSAAAPSSPEEDPVYIRMNDLDARVQRIERVLTNQSLLELAQRLDALQADVRTIRGEVELLQNETQGGKNADAAICTATSKSGWPRSRRWAASVAAPALGADAGAGVRAPPSRPPTTPAWRRCAAATTTRRWPRSAKWSLTTRPETWRANAQFWIGESYYTKGDLESAVTAYRKVLADWPDSRKAPDAMVKLGFSLSDLKRTGEARSTLEEVVRKYPGHQRRAARRGSPEAPRKMIEGR